MNKKHTKIYKIISVAFSVVISIVLALTLVATTLIGVGRDYLISQKFNSQIDSTDLASLTFIQNGEKVTLEKYVKDYVTEKIEKYIRENPLNNFTNLLYPFADSITDFAVDKALSSEYINNAVKTQVHSIFNYFLYSDVDDAKQRIKDGITLENNVALNPENAPTFEERVDAEVKMAVFKYIEEESGLSCDSIIVLLSENTVSTLKTISIILAIALLILNIKSLFKIPLYSGAVFCCCSSVMTYLRTEFNEYFETMQDLISYQFLKPVMDEYVPYIEQFLTYGIICLALFIALTVGLKFFKKNK